MSSAACGKRKGFAYAYVIGIGDFLGPALADTSPAFKPPRRLFGAVPTLAVSQSGLVVGGARAPIAIDQCARKMVGAHHGWTDGTWQRRQWRRGGCGQRGIAWRVRRGNAWRVRRGNAWRVRRGIAWRVRRGIAWRVRHGIAWRVRHGIWAVRCGGWIGFTVLASLCIKYTEAAADQKCCR